MVFLYTEHMHTHMHAHAYMLHKKTHGSYIVKSTFYSEVNLLSQSFILCPSVLRQQEDTQKGSKLQNEYSWESTIPGKTIMLTGKVSCTCHNTIILYSYLLYHMYMQYISVFTSPVFESCMCIQYYSKTMLLSLVFYQACSNCVNRATSGS